MLAGAGVVLAFYLRGRMRHSAPPVPRVQLTIRESAHGFELNRSLGGRTLFRLQAATAVQLRRHQRAILRQVKIDIYQADGQHVDQLYGQKFEYRPESGMVTAPGLVHIDLGGRLGPETGFQQPPSEERGNPIHIEAHNLNFNLHTGLGVSSGGIQFRYLEASGQADSVFLSSHPNQARLEGGVQLVWRRPGQPEFRLRAQQALLDRATETIMLRGQPGQPVEIVQLGFTGGAARAQPAGLRQTAAEPPTARFEAPVMTLYLRPDYSVARMHFTGGLRGQWLAANQRMNLRSASGWLWMRPTASAANPQARSAALRAAAGLARKAAAAQPKRKANPRPASGRLANNLLPRQSAQIASLRLRGDVVIHRLLPGQTETLQAQLIEAGFAPGNHLRHVTMRGSAQLEIRHAAGAAKAAGKATSRVAAASAQPPAGGLRLPSLPFPGAASGQGDWTIAAPRLDFAFQPGGAAPGTLARITRLPSSRLKQVIAAQAGSATPPRLIFQAPGRTPASAQSPHMQFEFGGNNRIQSAGMSGGVRLQSARRSPHGLEARVNTAERLQMQFDAAGRLEFAREDGRVELRQGTATARADQLRYAAASEQVRLLALNGSDYSGGQVQVRTPQFRLMSREVIAVRSTGLVRTPGAVRIAMLPQAGMGLNFLPASGPAGAATGRNDGETVNLAAGAMEAYQNTGWALFTHSARLWQGPNLISADRLLFERSRQTLAAGGGVSSVFMLPAAKPGAKNRPGLKIPGRQGTSGAQPARSLAIRSQSLQFSQLRHEATYSGAVTMTSGATEMHAHLLHIFFSAGAQAHGAGQLRRVEALGAVKLRSKTRRGQAERVDYDLARNLITMQGGTPSIYDAELGFLTGRSLTFNPAEDSIKVESWSNARIYTTYYPKKQNPQ